MKGWFVLLFRSRASAFQLIARSRIDDRNALGEVIGVKHRELVAEFAMHDGEYQIEDAEGNIAIHAQIRGHFCDTEEQARAKGWTDEERELVEAKLLEYSRVQPGECSLMELPKPARPWPKYDDTAEDNLALFAETAGLLGEALAYERATLKRAKVIKALEQAVAEQEAEQQMAVAR